MKPRWWWFILAAGCSHSSSLRMSQAQEVGPSPHAHHAPTAHSYSLQELAQGAALIPNLGSHQREVTTRSHSAQQFFNQGLRLLYGFNHDEAARAFAKAAELDPSCAMCFWGVSLSLGPNYNIPMLPDRAKAAWEALEEARAKSSGAMPVEQALIEALSHRYGGPQPMAPEAMQPLLQAYADQMRQVAARYPADDDVQVLFAESLMNLYPWKLWSLQGEPAPITLEAARTLEKVLQRSENHPGANHYYIHVIEPSPYPEKALPSAGRLAGLMPGAGHLVHMPAHIYQRVGRYADASRHNRAAAVADLEYIQRFKPFGYYPFYLGHNYGFLAFSASMEGRRAETLEAARKSVQHIPMDVVCAMPGMDFFLALPYFAAVRFGVWDQMLKEPRPEARYQVLTGLWLHGRGMALASTGKVEEARKLAGELEQLRTALSPDITADVTVARELLGVAAQILRARIAERAGEPQALALWERAVAATDQLPYSEPNDWFYPVRHYQGAALLAAGKAQQAEQVYREDLRRNPHNGWALWGLMTAQERLGRAEEAAQTRATFQRAWAASDIELASTAF